MCGIAEWRGSVFVGAFSRLCVAVTSHLLSSAQHESIPIHAFVQ